MGKTKPDNPGFPESGKFIKDHAHDVGSVKHVLETQTFIDAASIFEVQSDQPIYGSPAVSRSLF